MTEGWSTLSRALLQQTKRKREKFRIEGCRGTRLRKLTESRSYLSVSAEAPRSRARLRFRQMSRSRMYHVGFLVSIFHQHRLSIYARVSLILALVIFNFLLFSPDRKEIAPIAPPSKLFHRVFTPYCPRSSLVRNCKSS